MSENQLSLAQTRAATTLSMEYILRSMYGSARRFGGDYECTVIYLTIATASLGAVIRHGDYATRPEELAASPPSGLGAVSRASISRATGIPRETVRRKINTLIADGLVLDGGTAGLTIRPRGGRTPEFEEAMRLNTVSLKRLFSGLKRYAGLQF